MAIIPPNTTKLCQVGPWCGRPAQAVLKSPDGDKDICLTHHRIFTTGEFGERAIPPWTRERALDALINQDGLDAGSAAKRVNKHFGVSETQ